MKLIKRPIKKLINEAHSLIWTVAGTALVLITLSGDVQKTALWISGVALVLHVFGVMLKKDSE